MAHPFFVDLVRRGSSAVEEWRESKAWRTLDLSGADLQGIDLSGVHLGFDPRRLNISENELTMEDLKGSNLRGANLTGMTLDACNLEHCDFTDAILRGARLRDADLDGAHFNGADLAAADVSSSAGLARVDFVGAVLEASSFHGRVASCNFTNANLTKAKFFAVTFDDVTFHGADVTGASLHRVVLADCDLSSCRGLDTAHHHYPTSIDVGSLYKTHRSLGQPFPPDLRTFFLVSGAPDFLLDHLQAQFNSRPATFWRCFISYSVQDDAFASRLFADLTAAGITCWKFDVSATIGRGVWANIDWAIRSYDKVILVCSARSLQRGPVLRELERALQREDDLRASKAKHPTVDSDVLFPVRIDDYVFDGWQHERRSDVISKVVGDFRQWDTNVEKYQKELVRLRGALDPRSLGEVG